MLGSFASSTGRRLNLKRQYFTVVHIHGGMRWTLPVEFEVGQWPVSFVPWPRQRRYSKVRAAAQGRLLPQPHLGPCLPVDLPDFLADQLASQPAKPCACADQHGGSGQYVFLGADGGHYRRSNYARRVFRPACDGCNEAGQGQPARLVIADATHWPGVPVATWPAAQPGTGLDADAGYQPPRGRAVQAIPPDTPLACWLPLKPGLTPHGLRRSHKTWMVEDGIPEILAERRLGHEVPGMRGAVRPRVGPDARRPESRPPGPLGRLPARPRRHRPALTRAAARRPAGAVPQ